MRRIGAIGVFLFCYLAAAGRAGAATVLIEDTFSDISKIDPVRTTAEVDTTNGWVTLGNRVPANMLLLYEDNYEIALINGNSLDTYRFDGNHMEREPGFSVSGLTSPVSVSSNKKGEYLILDQGAKAATYYYYDGIGLTSDPNPAAEGFINPISLSCVKNNLDFIILDNREIQYYCHDGREMVRNSPMSISLGYDSNPVSIAVSKDGLACAVVDQAAKQVKYYSFDGTSLVLNPLLSITEAGVLGNPRSIAIGGEAGCYAVVDTDSVKVFNFDGSVMVNNTMLSVTGLNNPTAVAMKTNCSEYAVLHYDAANEPIVCYYFFNGTGMEEIPELRITGLSPPNFTGGQVLMGKAVTGSEPINSLKLAADVEMPEGTDICWEVTADGISWQPAVNKGPAVRFCTSGVMPNYRAILSTNDPKVRPKIFSVRLIDASLWIGAFRITHIVGPRIPDNPALPSSRFPIQIWAGYNVTYNVDTAGRAQWIAAAINVNGRTIDSSSISGTITCLNPGEAENTWQGVFHTEVSLPKGTLLDISLTAARETESESMYYENFAEIYGSALENHTIHLTH